jgi:hypothetical protein
MKINWDEIVWEEIAPGARQKYVVRENLKLRLVEFTSEFVESDWCRKRHVGTVVTGACVIEFADRSQVYAAGDGVFLLGGEAEKHRARVPLGNVCFLFVEDV